MVGLSPSWPSLQGVSVLDVGLIDHVDIPVDQWGLLMELGRARCRGSQRSRVLLHVPSGLCLVPSPRGESCECP